MKVLQCDKVSRSIGNRQVVENITLEVEKGEIFGFLGPNGAGKTTTIRMITGLIEPTSGEISVMGYSMKKDRYSALKHIGAIVENPEMYTFLTGYENLKQISRMDRRIEDGRISEVAYQVGLSSRIHDKVKKYSLGMRQRLGVAQALLHKPDLLILDEPTNGLDPNGIIEFREMVRMLARKEGMAVFISSHILSEIEQLCDRAAIINLGAIQSIEDFRQRETKPRAIVIKVRNPKNAVRLLINEREVRKASVDGGYIHVEIDAEHVPAIVSLLTSSGVEIEEVYPKKEGLEERFIKIVGGRH